MTVWLIATLDTKGSEIAFVREELTRCHISTRVIDVGCLGEPSFAADVSRERVFEAAGTTLEERQRQGDRGEAVRLASRGIVPIVQQLHQRGELAGVLGIGGSAGTTIATAAMRALPIGVPKVMISTLASGQTRPYVGVKDLLLLNAVVDIAGINRVSRQILSQGARALAGMVHFPPPEPSQADRPLIAATMFGVTTPCVQEARRILEERGYEVLVFHATGTGGEAMEALIDDGLFAGVLDLTTTELADELVGGILSAGPRRLTAAARRGIPQVVSVGATDMVNFGPPETIPERFRERKFHHHNPTVTLMRTTADECRALGAEIASKVSASTGPAAILLPWKGVSAIDAEGQPFDDPAAREALFAGMRENRGEVELIETPYHINDREFAQAAAERLMAYIEKTSTSATGSTPPATNL